MPSITSGRVLVTGANGFVAVWVLKYLLERSFSVRGTIRSESKAKYLRELFKSYKDKLEFVVIEDMTKEGAFDDAVGGVDAILHVASPVNLRAEDPDELIIPAVKGTQNLLQSALKHRTTVKRVVYTSSCAAVVTMEPDAPPCVYDERDWNDLAVKEVQEKGREAHPFDKYRASKVLAERAAWEFYKREKERLGDALGWDLTSLVPPYILGPPLHEIPSLDEFRGTSRDWYDNVVRGVPAGPGFLAKAGYEYLDVRDFAHAQVLALLTPAAGGERIIIRGGSFTWQQFVNAARRYSDKVPAGDPSLDPAKVPYPVRYNAEKSIRILGIQYRTLEETTKDSLEDFKARG